MAHAKVKSDLVVERLMHVFRSVGSDGASLTELSSATGLKKASLYHRFPGGKVEMAHAVLDYVLERNDSQIFGILFSSGLATERLDTALSSIHDLYKGGRLACILRAMSHGTAEALFRDKIADILERWVGAFKHLALDMGRDSNTAKKLGESALIKIQGSLILAQTMQKPDFFQEALVDIKTDFLR